LERILLRVPTHWLTHRGYQIIDVKNELVCQVRKTKHITRTEPSMAVSVRAGVVRDSWRECILPGQGGERNHRGLFPQIPAGKTGR
jgi:hypothetical protein